MTPRVLLAIALVLAGPASLRADDLPSPVKQAVSTATSSTYDQVTATSADALACADTLQLASDTRDALQPLLRLGTTWRFPVHIHLLTVDDPLTAKIDHEAAAVFAKGDTMKIEAVVPVGDPNAKEFIQRQFVTALLYERFFASTKAFDKETHLDVVPMWLVEGLREIISDDSGHNREAIVRRAIQNKTAPSLNEILGWHQISPDRLLGLWQRAFCYYLVASLTARGEHLDDFQQWLDGVAADGGGLGRLHFPTEAAWQRELSDVTARSRDIVYTWDDTLSDLTNDESITYADSKNGKIQACTLDNVVDAQPTPALLQAIGERINVLTALELRSHISWHSVLENYRSGLTALLSDDTTSGARKFFEEAHRQRMTEMAYHQKLLDYVNWFEVTKDYAGDASRFNDYFSTAREMTRVEADPAHPNPIRASLLQMESEL